MNNVTDQMFKHAMDTQTKIIRMQMEQSNKIREMMERIEKIEDRLNDKVTI